MDKVIAENYCTMRAKSDIYKEKNFKNADNSF